jgi:hypothetical protein
MKAQNKICEMVNKTLYKPEKSEWYVYKCIEMQTNMQQVAFTTVYYLNLY